MPMSDEQRAAQFQLAQKLEAEGQQEGARRLYAAMAREGDIAALTALGRNMLVREPLATYEGVKAIVDAANRGGGEAIHFCGVMSALGAGLAQNWDMALGCLQASAERDWLPAQDELRLLAGGSGAAWKSLRDAIDLPALLAPGELRQVHAGPRIALAGKFLSPALCDWLIARARPKIVRARTFDGEAAAQLDSGRSNGAAEFNFADIDIVLALIRTRIAAITGLPAFGMENTQVLHYAPGQRFAPHYDYLDPAQPRVAQTIARGGQRVATFLVYLNDDFDAAETSFLKLGWRYRGQKGDAILFWNVDPSGAPDPATLHEGLAPSRGEKWLLSQWIRLPPAASVQTLQQ
jgi:hypothetical protein